MTTAAARVSCTPFNPNPPPFHRHKYTLPSFLLTFLPHFTSPPMPSMYTPSLSLLPLLLPLVSAFNSYRAPLIDCLNAASVPILLSSSVGWSEQIEPFNLRFTPVPNVVALPRNVANVCLLTPTLQAGGQELTN